MRKSRRIGILNQQIEKLNDEKYEKDERWVVQTLTYMNRFFGENSPQSIYTKGFKFYGFVPLPCTPESIENDRIERINEAKRFLQDCIEIIKNNGVEIKNHNFLEKFSNQALIPVIVSIIGGLLYVGYLFGTSTTDSKNIEIKQENKQLIKENEILKDSLSAIKATFKISKNISK